MLADACVLCADDGEPGRTGGSELLWGGGAVDSGECFWVTHSPRLRTTSSAPVTAVGGIVGSAFGPRWSSRRQSWRHSNRRALTRFVDLIRPVLPLTSGQTAGAGMSLRCKTSVPASAYQPSTVVEPVGIPNIIPQARPAASGVFLCIAREKHRCGLWIFTSERWFARARCVVAGRFSGRLRANVPPILRKWKIGRAQRRRRRLFVGRPPVRNTGLLCP